MATIRSRGNKFHVQVRKIGYPTVTKTFSSISVAKQWAKITEAVMEGCLHAVIPDDTTVGELLDKYETVIVPTHKGCRVEAYKVLTPASVGEVGVTTQAPRLDIEINRKIQENLAQITSFLG